MVIYLLALAGAMVATLALTPLVRWVAARAAIIDNPDGYRKLQKQAVPLLGGVALLAGWWIGVAIFGHAAPTVKLPRAALPAGISLVLLAIMGVVDDIYRLRARWKLLGQVVAVLPVVLAGYSLERIALGSFSVELGMLATPAALFWLVLGINSLNLLDGMDGMASVISVGVAATLVAIAALNHQPGIVLVTLPLLGALVGFLAFNLPPAKIYLGDAGSMVIGFALSLTSLVVARSADGATRVTILFAIMAIPVADTTLAVLRRSLSGRGFWHPDRAHIHHRLLDRGMRPKQILLLFLGVSALWTPIVVIAVQKHSDSIVWAAAVIAAIVAVRMRLAGHHEWASLMNSTSHSLAQAVFSRPSPARLREMPFDVAWDRLVTSLSRHSIETIVLSVEDGDGGLAEHSWRHGDAGPVASAIEIIHGSSQARCCRLRIESSRTVGTTQWSRSVRIADRFAKFWATHPETVTPTSPAFSTDAPATLPGHWETTSTLAEGRAA